jgi:hypothetical protein
MKKTYVIVWNAHGKECSSVCVVTDHLLKGRGRITAVQCGLHYVKNDSPAHRDF